MSSTPSLPAIARNAAAPQAWRSDLDALTRRRRWAAGCVLGGFGTFLALVVTTVAILANREPSARPDDAPVGASIAGDPTSPMLPSTSAAPVTLVIGGRYHVIERTNGIGSTTVFALELGRPYTVPTIGLSVIGLYTTRVFGFDVSAHITGVLEDSVLRGTWQEGEASTGPFALTFSPDGSSFSGTWRTADGAVTGTWSGQRTSSP